jgi:hypothetical protein
MGAAAMMQGALYRGEEGFDPLLQTIKLVEGVGNVKAAVGRKDCRSDGCQVGRFACGQSGKPGIDHALGSVAIPALKCHGTVSFNSHDKGAICIRSQSKNLAFAIFRSPWLAAA